MKKILALSAFLTVALASMGQTSRNGQNFVSPLPCSAAHKDAAVNNQVTITIAPPPQSDQFVYICGWDFQAVQDATGGAQTNVSFTTTNLGNPSVAASYSAAAVPNAMVSGNFTYPTPIAASASGQPVVFTSPAAAGHTAYFLNVYYRYGY